MRVFRIAMAQMNPTVGDIPGNVVRIRQGIREARKAKADLIAFPELAITGYPPEDLLLKPQFLAENRRALDELIRECRTTAAVIGYVAQGGPSPHTADQQLIVPAGRHALYNGAAVIANQTLVTTYCKLYLPNYGVFDESRYFHPGHRMPVLVLNGTCVGVNICEDIWLPDGPTRLQAMAGAELIVNINASPFHLGKSRFREQMLATRARDNGVIVTYTNMVGGQDELVFDGNSVIVDEAGSVIVRGQPFEEDFIVADLNMTGVARRRLSGGRKGWQWGRTTIRAERVTISADYAKRARPRHVPPHREMIEATDEVYRALVMGVRDYVRKNGFRRVVIGLSGGIDSALTAVIAVDALGAKNVLGVFMPSPYTSAESGHDVRDLVARLHIDLETVPISRTFTSYRTTLEPVFSGRPADTTEENLQARIRGNILMAFSNKFGHLVLTTGNKSELSVGYATLYGDMAGGFAVIKDVPKTMVYELTEFRNRQGAQPVIPKRIVERAPTAELKPNQKDQDTLPPYELLDPILKAYVEEDRAPEEIVDMGFDGAMVDRVIAMVDRSEYKRRQAPVGIKITHRAFGKDRRMPITNGYRH